jgi:hypothetical protein
MAEKIQDTVATDEKKKAAKGRIKNSALDRRERR